MDFVSIDLWTLIFTWVNLFILFLIMKKLLFKPVMKMLAERENEVSSMYEKAESAQQNAENLESEYTQKLSEAKEEAARIMKNATDAANKKGEQIVFEAQEKASASIIKAQKEIEREKLNAEEFECFMSGKELPEPVIPAAAEPIEEEILPEEEAESPVSEEAEQAADETEAPVEE